MTDQMQDYSGWIGHQVVDQAGDRVGKVSNIYLDDQSGQPEWLAISTGMFAKRSSFVPMQGATASGDELVIGRDKATVKDALRSKTTLTATSRPKRRRNCTATAVKRCRPRPRRRITAATRMALTRSAVTHRALPPMMP
jgi:sporulation protein YlmC with PRC-barrel domain